MHYKKTVGDRVFDAIILIFVIIVIAITLYPLIYTLSMAISDPQQAAAGKVVLLPKGLNFTAIGRVLNDKQIFTYYYNTIWYTVVGTVLGIIATALAAYPLSRKEFKAAPTIMKFIMFTMFFGGGMIPSYIVNTKFLHLYNSRWALILPGLTSAWYIVVCRNFFLSLPEEIIESARLDGASEYRILAQLVIPLSKPVMAVLALYYSVSHWNSYFGALLYLGKKELHPLSMYVRRVVINNSLSSLSEEAVDISSDQLLSSLQIKYAVIVVSVVPLLLVYPFLSKNLEKGLMIGAVKG